MNLETFLSMPVSDQAKLIKQPIRSTTPFWMERLNTALLKNSPNALAFLDERLVTIYNNLKSMSYEQMGIGGTV